MDIQTSWRGSKFPAKINVFLMVCFIGENEMKIVPFVDQRSHKYFKSLFINLTNGVLEIPRHVKSEHKVKEMYL